MIDICEHYGTFDKGRVYAGLSDDCRERFQKFVTYSYTVPRKEKEHPCYHICFDKEEKDYLFKTSYFVGLDWLDYRKDLKIYVTPKLDQGGGAEVDYMGMLLEALQEPENFAHLDELVHIYFDKPYIGIASKQDMLSPFLIAQFMQVLKRIVQKGLKKSYYTVSENLNGKIKGKILTAQNIKRNIARGRNTHTMCRYQEYGINCDENKILKKAYLFSCRVIRQYENGVDKQPLLQLMQYIHPAFGQVSDDIDLLTVKSFKSNPLYKEYDQALRLALLILKRFSYNISQAGQEKISTPPFWIDMSKLFELYVFKKLRDIFGADVQYHVTARQNQEIDFILRSSDRSLQFVIDTKYKPGYHEHTIKTDDIRQLCGYARLEKVYRELGITDYSKNIDCLIIYSHQACDQQIEKEHFIYSKSYTGNNKIRKQSGYVNFYKLGIKLPLK